MCAHCEHAQRDPSENLEHVVRPGGGHLTFAPSSLHQVASPREAVGEAGMQAVASVGGSRTGQGPGSCHQCDSEPAGVLLVTALQQPSHCQLPFAHEERAAVSRVGTGPVWDQRRERPAGRGGQRSGMS